MRLGLRTQLLGVTAVLLAMLTLGSLRAVQYYLGQQVREQAERRLRSGAHVLTSIMERTEEQLQGRGRILTELPSLRVALTQSPKDLEPLLQEIKSLRTANLLWATDAGGVVLAGTGEYPPPGQPLTDHPLISRALQGQHALGFDVFLSEWWLLLALPVREAEGSPPIGTVTLALLIGEAYLERLVHLIGTEVGYVWGRQTSWSQGWPASTQSAIAAQAAQVGPVTPQVEALGPQGRYLWLAQPVTSMGLHPTTAQPIALLGLRLDESVIQKTAQAIGWIALAVMAGGILLLVGAIRSITQPLKGLVADSQRVGGGDLAHRAEVRGANEVAELAHSFNQMVERLRDSRDELLRVHQYNESIIRQMINSLIVTDPAGIIQRVNPATLTLLGYSEEELIGRPLSTLFIDESALFTGDRWREFLQQGAIKNLEATCRSKRDNRIPVLFSGSVMRGEDGDVQGIVCMAQDITERKSLDDLKDAFISTISHELRTPLTTIGEGLALALDGTLGSLNAEQRDFLQMVNRDAKRLRRLVTTLLDLAMLESGTSVIRRQPMSLEPVVTRAWEVYTAEAGARTLIRRLGTIPSVSGDHERLLAVFEHLFSNAIQFTPVDGVITVSVEPQGELLAVAVADNGSGMAREELRQIFQKFVQLGRAEEERSGGTGLGLAYCKRVVELHGGTIQVDSDVGKGTTITFTLPSTPRP